MFSARDLATLALIFLFILYTVSYNFNIATAKTYMFTALIFAAALIIVRADYAIIPRIIRSYRIMDFKVRNNKYLICKLRGQPRYAGITFVKLIPQVVVQSMSEKDRNAFIMSLSGTLAGGGEYEFIYGYTSIADVRGKNALDKIRELKKRAVMFARYDRRHQVKMEYEREEEKLLGAQTTSGIFFAGIRVYGMSEDEVVRKLETQIKAIRGRFIGIGVAVKEFENYELNKLITFFLCGNTLQDAKALGV